jgi:hypothetical protein
MHYKLVMPSDLHAAAILRATVDALRENKELQRDFQRLNKACCGPNSLVQVLGAPLPLASAYGALQQSLMSRIRLRELVVRNLTLRLRH